MPSGNGNRAAQKRERNLKAAAAATGGKSQLKVNAAAMNTACGICRQTFLCTTKEPELRAHFDAKHGKGFSISQAFPHLS